MSGEKEKKKEKNLTGEFSAINLWFLPQSKKVNNNLLVITFRPSNGS